MLAIPKTAVLHRDTAAATQPSHAAVEASAVAQARNFTSVVPEPVLISERQVTFATAVALGAPRPCTAPRPGLIALWQRLVRSVSVEREPRRRYPPRRISYFEQAATAREMDRL
ncbi:hypothetical protein BN1232_06246 [Mycobacterium lentiflavum]|nr:hypothetical protein BN1232_06246 [Mycobacterium lentiflavum]